MSAYISLGYECNHKCITCPITTADRFTPRIDFETIKRSVDALLQEEKLDSVTVSGGEPTLSPFLFDLLAYLRDCGVFTVLLTNGDSLSQVELADRLKQSVDERTFCAVSAIHHHQAERHDSITQVDGSFDRTVKGLKNMTERGLSVTVKHIISRLNYQSLECFASFVADLFPPQVSVEFCGMDFCGRAGKRIDEYFVAYSEAAVYLEQAIEFFRRHDRQERNISIAELPLCSIDPFYWRYFNMRNEPLQLYTAPNVTNSSRSVRNTASECRNDYRQCMECDVRQFCPGCWQSAYSYDSGIIQPVKSIDMEE